MFKFFFVVVVVSHIITYFRLIIKLLIKTVDFSEVAGGAAGVDGRLMKGDQILAVNGQDVRKASQEEAAAVLKTTTGKVTLKMGRLKARSSASSSDK